MRLPAGGRVAVIGAGPSGLVVAKHALEAGFEPTVFEASDGLGGQWDTSAPHSGVWPGMHTNTSRAMTAFSDFPAPDSHPLHPAAEQIHAYLRAYAGHFGVTPRIRFGTRVEHVGPGWRVDGERFDAVVAASGRFRRPTSPPGFERFAGEVLHAFDYPGRAAFAGRRVLVYGNGISALEIASDLALTTDVVSAFRKPRYVIRKVVDGVSSDWQWYTAFGALERRHVERGMLGRRIRDRVIRVAGDPAWYGAPAPGPDFFAAGISLCQDYLEQVRDGRIACRPAVTGVDGRTVRFADGTAAAVDAIVLATGYTLDVPYLDEHVWSVTGPSLALYHRTFHPDLPGFGSVGLFAAQGPFFPLLELQARWLVALWAGDAVPPSTARLRESLAGPVPPLEVHNAFATALADELGVAPDLFSRPELTEPLLFGPLLPPRYRFDGPGARPDAVAHFRAQLAASPRAPVDPADVEALRGFGLGEAADRILAATTRA
jgi:dimethylaniline monooxygenase (N-oxide forming)